MNLNGGNVSLPIEVMTEIFQLRLEEMVALEREGKTVPQDYINILSDAYMVTSKRHDELNESFREAANRVLEYGRRIIEMSNDIKRERRIVHLFLQNHGLDYKYENFEARILERIFKEGK